MLRLEESLRAEGSRAVATGAFVENPASTRGVALSMIS